MLEQLSSYLGTTKLISFLVPPVAGLSGFYSFIQFAEGKILYGVAGAVALIIVALFANYVRLRLGTQQNTITADKNNDDTSVQLANIMQGTMDKVLASTERIVQSANEESARREAFWTGRIDAVGSTLRAECEKEKQFWVAREEALRDEKHKVGNECSAISLKYDFISIQLKAKGIMITDKAELVWHDFCAEETKTGGV